jgi:hypothetical protein
VAMDGRWNAVIDTSMGKQHVELDLTVSGDTVTGTASQSGLTAPLEQGRVDGDDLTWQVSVTRPFPMTLTFTVTVSGDEMAGNVQAGSFPAAPLTGIRA